MKNASRHAEMVAIDQVLETFSKEIFKKCSLFVTIEPCLMCSSALVLLGIGKVYCCAGNDRFGGCGSVLNIHQQENNSYECYLFEKKEATEILKNFYSNDNPFVPFEKKKK
eukprot:gene2442-3153_t